MKVLLMVLLAIVVFLGCAVIGFQFANKVNTPQPVLPTTDPGAEFRGDQYRLMLVRVDRLDSSQPKLISTWFVSLYFLENSPAILNIAPIYPGDSTDKTERLKQSFGFTVEGQLSPAFLDAVRAYDVTWDSFIVLDNEGANRFLQWLVGPGDFTSAITAAASSAENRTLMVEQTCHSIADASHKDPESFNWGSMIPAHFRSDLYLDVGLTYWDRLVDSGPARCEILPPPE